MPTYTLNKDVDIRSDSPFWVLGVVRYQTRATFNRRHTDDSLMSFKVDPNEEREPLIITSATGLQISGAKSSHVTTLNASLPNDFNYLTHIFPGDWIMAWIVDGEAKAEELVNRLSQNMDCSAVEYGLKFMGKVHTITKRTSIDRTRGAIQSSYQMTAAGFSEFDTTIYYEPSITQSMSEPVFLKQIGLALNDILAKGSKARNSVLADPEEGHITANTIVPDKMVPAFLAMMFGLTGPLSETASVKNFATGDTVRQAPHQAYLMPATVMKWMGGSGPTYSDLLNVFTGLQMYGAGESRDFSKWMPTNIEPDPGIYPHHFKCKNVRANFHITPPPLNTSVWSAISTYLNAPVNEMFVSLKPITKEGKTSIKPALTYRQNPFSSGAVKVRETRFLTDDENRLAVKDPAQLSPEEQKKQADVLRKREDKAEVTVTQFLSLPTWKIPPNIIWDQVVSRNGAARVNYLTVFATPTVAIDMPAQMVNNVPNQDEVDIARHGVRPYLAQTNALAQDWLDGPRGWKALMSDIIMNEHLTLSGSMTLAGVYEPIAVGDNAESSDIVYHIESLSHSCSISPTGQKQFSTSLMLSHGVNAGQTPTLYPGLENKDLPQSTDITAENSLRINKEDS